MSILESYLAGKWVSGSGPGKPIKSAVTGTEVALISSEGVNFSEMLDYARKEGNPRLRAMTFHERARMVKALAQHLMEHKDRFYDLSRHTGATKVDSWIDIEGGIGTLFVGSSKVRRELPDDVCWTEGNFEQLSKNGTFGGVHICTPLLGVALHINAFNFPCWGMLEKLSHTFLAGMPAIIKPASQTSYLAQAMVSEMLESGILPAGALQLICGGVGDLFDHLTSQDVVTFTGSASTGKKLRSHPRILEHSVRFNMEADSLNAIVLGPDVTVEMPEYGLFIKEVQREMTVKAGQKCTAIRRIFVPESLLARVSNDLQSKLSAVVIGDPASEGVRMGPLVSEEQAKDVAAKCALLAKEAEMLCGGSISDVLQGVETCFQPTLFICRDPENAEAPHSVEAFGPVSTLMPYGTLSDAIRLVNLGQGSLVASIVSADDRVARELTLAIAPFHGRVLVLNDRCAAESTGHGSPMPHLTHGGPGRAGGGEELGGIRGLMFYMQRTALQGSPTTLSAITHEYFPGASTHEDRLHPFTKYFDDLSVGDTIVTHRRTITETDIVSFAGVSGDYFYAHTDEIAATRSIFKKRVAHGYFLIAAAAGLFVSPGEGPVLANYGLERLRFLQPVGIGDTIQVRLTCKRKIAKEKRDDEMPLHGIVEWDTEIRNQYDEPVATYTVLTLVRRREGH